VLHNLVTLGPAHEQQFSTELMQVQHGTKEKADEVLVMAYVRGVSSAGPPLRAVGDVQPLGGPARPALCP